MSEQNRNEQEAVTPAELSEESLENVAGGTYIIDGGCTGGNGDGVYTPPTLPTY